MGESDGSWGQLQQHDDDRAAAWDRCDPLPEHGVNPALDAFIQRKRITRASLIRIGTRMADQHVLCFAGPKYLKFRDVVSDRRWSYADCDWSLMRIVRAGAERWRTVLVVEGETDAARCTAAYPAADVAVLPAGALHWPATFADQLRDYELVLVGLDTDRAGEEGAAKIAESLPQAVRFAPPVNDWCSTPDDELPPLPDPDDFQRDDLVGGLTFVDLAAILEDGAVPDPEILVDDLLYTEGVHFFNGHPGSGKTTLVMHSAIMVMSLGRDVVWLDYEGGVRPTLRRLLSCGCPVELLPRFHYSPWPGDANKALLDIAARWPEAMVVYDSASKALQTLGIDENSPSEVTGWATQIVYAAKTQALPIVVIDHVTKDATKGSRYGRGSGSKLADSDVMWYVDKVSDFNRDTVGTLAVHQQKDREGFLPFESWYQIGDGKGRLTMVAIDVPPCEEDAPVDPPPRPQPGEPAI